MSYGYPTPPPKQGMSTGAKVAVFGCGGIAAFALLMGGCAALVAVGSDTDTDTDSSSRKTDSVPKAPGTKSPKTSPKDTGNVKPPATEAEQFKGCVNKNGTATEKAAVKHVVKVTGTAERNDILDSADVYTDFTGGFGSSDSGSAKLIAAAFATCYESDNGLVTIYGEDGNMIANGEY